MVLFQSIQRPTQQKKSRATACNNSSGSTSARARLRKDQEVDTQVLMSQIYAAFNKRDIDGTLALMSEDVSWPKASEGGSVIGKLAIREYWTRQWAEFDPLVYVLEVINRESGVTDVKVHQLVKDLKGNILSDTELWHVYSFTDGLIDRMEIKEGEGTLEGPSVAFTGAKHTLD
jgi:hypothetical protein